MSRVAIHTSAHTTNFGEWACLRETAKKFGVRMDVAGVGDQSLPQWGPLFIDAIARIKDMQEPYVLTTDSFDTFLARWDEQEVVEAIEGSPGKLLVGAEDWCWPPGPWCSAYDGPMGSPWYAINGGGMCGTREAVAQMVGAWLDRHDYTPGVNQELMHKMLAEGYPMEVDVNCRIFQTFHGSHGHLVVVDGDVARNTVTGSRPMVLHWNGTTPGMRKWYEQLNGGSWPRVSSRNPD